MTVENYQLLDYAQTLYDQAYKAYLASPEYQAVLAQLAHYNNDPASYGADSEDGLQPFPYSFPVWDEQAEVDKAMLAAVDYFSTVEQTGEAPADSTPYVDPYAGLTTEEREAVEAYAQSLYNQELGSFKEKEHQYSNDPAGWGADSEDGLQPFPYSFDREAVVEQATADAVAHLQAGGDMTPLPDPFWLNPPPGDPGDSGGDFGGTDAGDWGGYDDGTGSYNEHDQPGSYNEDTGGYYGGTDSGGGTGDYPTLDDMLATPSFDEYANAFTQDDFGGTPDMSAQDIVEAYVNAVDPNSAMYTGGGEITMDDLIGLINMPEADPAYDMDPTMADEYADANTQDEPSGFLEGVLGKNWMATLLDLFVQYNPVAQGVDAFTGALLNLDQNLANLFGENPDAGTGGGSFGDSDSGGEGSVPAAPEPPGSEPAQLPQELLDLIAALGQQPPVQMPSRTPGWAQPVQSYRPPATQFFGGSRWLGGT